MPLLRPGGYAHRIQKLCPGNYRLTWSYDVKYGRLRYPRQMHRDTDLKGAQRFARKWSVRMPDNAD